MEVAAHPSIETGGILIGHRREDVFYIVENIDPGWNSTFLPAFFEYDEKYIDHLANKTAKLYEKEPALLGLWHRHPGSFDRFSGTDDHTNRKFALQEGVVISGIVNIDPEFRLTLYAFDQTMKYRRIPWEVGDEHIPEELRRFFSDDLIKQVITEQETGALSGNDNRVGD